jgi:hypothetical protein
MAPEALPTVESPSIVPADLNALCELAEQYSTATDAFNAKDRACDALDAGCTLLSSAHPHLANRAKWLVAGVKSYKAGIEGGRLGRENKISMNEERDDKMSRDFEEEKLQFELRQEPISFTRLAARIGKRTEYDLSKNAAANAIRRGHKALGWPAPTGWPAKGADWSNDVR